MALTWPPSHAGYEPVQYVRQGLQAAYRADRQLPQIREATAPGQAPRADLLRFAGLAGHSLRCPICLSSHFAVPSDRIP